MKIGELAQRTGLSASRIRFYEKIGLLKAVDRQANGYRSYPVEAVTILNVVSTAQSAGFSLDEIRTLLPNEESGWKRDTLLAALRRKIGDIALLEKRLAQTKARLFETIKAVETRPEGLDCTQNAQRVLSHLRDGNK